jgi:hypothetical protein
MTVNVPSPFELYTSLRRASYTAASGCSPMRSDAICLPLCESVTTMTFPSHTENSR